MMGLSPHQETRGGKKLSLYCVRRQQERGLLQTRKKVLTRHWISWHLDFGLHSLQKYEKWSNAWPSHLVHGILLAQPEQTEILLPEVPEPLLGPEQASAPGHCPATVCLLALVSRDLMGGPGSCWPRRCYLCVEMETSVAQQDGVCHTQATLVPQPHSDTALRS